jgi:demethylmenaquinone methyltransferase/2-methoxy-6-polyprenyl-1,4-benzoquinol methylase
MGALMPDPLQVRAMFARIAGRYDLLNRILSLGIDRRWRKRLLAAAGDVRGRRAVDACCGTGDVTLELADAGAAAVGVDFTPEMLARARHKANRSTVRAVFAHGDALKLPVKSGSADVCTVAFGIRNVADRAQALREMARVLRPGGRALVLEFTMPRGRISGRLYRAYFTRVLPAIGSWISRDRDAYSYLPRTVLEWPTPNELAREMEGAGFVDCRHELLTHGIACLHSARAPSRSAP